MMRSLFSGVSGLKNHQTRMDVIGNNISNVNTTGFKSSRVNFVDTLNQTLSAATSSTETLGGTNPKQVGLGSAIGSVDLLFNDGSVQSTGKNTDLCLTGNALFVVKEGQQTYYTRDGAFEFDGDGNYVLPGSGLKVQGWNGTDGVLDTSAAPTDVNVQAGKSMAASATVLATYANNLNAAAPTIESIAGGTVTSTITTMTASTTTPVTISDGTNTYNVTNGTFSSAETYTFSSAVAIGDDTIKLKDSKGNIQTLTLTADSTTATDANKNATPSGGTATTTTASAAASTTSPVTLTMSDGSKITQTNGTYEVDHSLPITTTLTIYDTLGNVHSLPIYFTKTTVSSAVGNTWSVSLNTDLADNNVDLSESDGTTTTVTMNTTTVDFTTSGKYDTTDGRNTGGRTTTLTLTNGALGTQTVTLELSSLTQFAGNNTVNGTTDGYAAGTLESISIDTTGTIYGTYTNGVKQAEAQVAVAQFTNASGLTKTGSSLYQASNNSGTPNVKTTTELVVKITPSALELSNVDIANEFADMIVTQRGFQSNSKMITVGDEMLESIINMKR